MLRNSAIGRRDIEAAIGVTEPLLEPNSPDSIKLKSSSRASSSQDGSMVLDADFDQPASKSRQTGEITFQQMFFKRNRRLAVEKHPDLVAFT